MQLKIISIDPSIQNISHLRDIYNEVTTATEPIDCKKLASFDEFLQINPGFVAKTLTDKPGHNKGFIMNFPPYINNFGFFILQPDARFIYQNLNLYLQKQTLSQDHEFRYQYFVNIFISILLNSLNTSGVTEFITDSEEDLYLFTCTRAG